MTWELTGETIVAAAEVHRELGPGLLESVYEACLVHELLRRGMKVRRQVEVPVSFRSERIDCGFRADLIVNESLIVELKAVEGIVPLHLAQLLTYLRLAHLPIGLLINFNVEYFNSGVRRVTNRGARSSKPR